MGRVEQVRVRAVGEEVREITLERAREGGERGWLGVCGAAMRLPDPHNAVNC